MFVTSYADYEALVVEQMQQMFAAGGFDTRRDIAGIVLNRWGHAFVTPPPGFFFGKKGAPSPLRIPPCEQPACRLAGSFSVKVGSKIGSGLPTPAAAP